MKKNKIALATALALALTASTSFASPATEVDTVTLDETTASVSDTGVENVHYGHSSGVSEGYTDSRQHDLEGQKYFEGESETWSEGSGVSYGITASAEHPTIGVTVEERFFAPRISGGVKSDNIDYNGGEVNWKDTLALANEHSPETILRYKNMSLDWIHFHSKGESNLASPLTFDGKTYNGKVDSKVNFDYLKFSVENPILKTSDGEVKWNYGLAGLLWDAEVTGNSGGANTSSSKSFGAPVPMVGLNAKANIAKGFNVYANASGLPLGGYGHIADLEAGLHYEPMKNLGLNVGYRLIDVDLQHKDDSASFRLAGPFAGLNYTF